MITPEFILAGHAIFTVNNNQGDYYTFKVTQAKNADLWFVSLLSGPDNESDYTYLGVIKSNGVFRLTAKSKLDENTLPIKVLNWALRMVWSNREIPEGYGINHAGKCGKCGRTLTRPEGVDSDGYRFGFGPICWESMNSGF